MQNVHLPGLYVHVYLAQGGVLAIEWNVDVIQTHWWVEWAG